MPKERQIKRLGETVSPYFQSISKLPRQKETVSKYFLSTKRCINDKHVFKKDDNKIHVNEPTVNQTSKKRVELSSVDLDVLAEKKIIPFVPKYIPMPSPLNLVQESLYYDPWKHLIATMFLNRTRGCQALPLLWKFLDEYPTPQIAIKADANKLADLLRPLGLQNIRAERIIKFSQSYLIRPNFSSPRELFGMGKYAEDSWRLFCGEKDNAWMKGSGFEPEDKVLKLYIEWRRQQYELVNCASVDGHLS
ncbi:DNA glycosylase [Gigaspora margarita]|uniref:Methyl-CpG-binding domain protein 4 n=1 Tax=Gigaspora margarita TaxID=4874 RepID=A0A8H3X218_GIGMA|nr:DNA glycosylase [Gigaspora margarita]